MIYTLIVRYNHLTNNYSAFNFAQALLGQQHSINNIYFMFDGAYIANGSIDMPSDEADLTTAWSQLAQKHNLKLSVCAASGLRRGITMQNMAPGFSNGSIGELVACCDLADQVVAL
jgi:tRNA 2-thiouridine synthesizing protein D